jgi:uncharacterized protein YggE
MEVTTVAAQGEAEAEFNLVGFSLQLTSLASTVPTAKKQLGSAITELNQALEAMKAKLGLDFAKNSLRSNSHTQERHEWRGNVNEFMGYQVTYSLSFEIAELDQVSRVYDTLTSLDSVSDGKRVKLSVGSPSFNLKPQSRERLNKKALKQAFARVTDRFQAECQVLGLDPTNFEVGAWEVNYSDSHRAPKTPHRTVATSARAMAGAPGAVRGESIEASPSEGAAGDGGDPAISFNAGLATVEVNLEVAFQRKSQNVSNF